MNNTGFTRRGLLVGTAGAALATQLGGTADAKGRPTPPATPPKLTDWARRTWRSMQAMTDTSTGLVSDNIGGDLATPARYTSPTNMGGYLWSCLVARDLGFLTPGHCRQRIARTLATLRRMDHHRPSGMYYNWYDPTDGSVVRSWPETGEPVVPFVSSVDMGWLGAALKVVANADPSNRKAASALFKQMRWDVFYDRNWGPPGGANFGGFYTEDPDLEGVSLLPPMNGVGGPDLWYTVSHHYDTAISEARMVTYLGISAGQIPPQAYFATHRTFPPDWTWPEMTPVGQWQTYLGIDVFEGAHPYLGMKVVPGWGGSMFEELMPDLFVDEAGWGPRSWGVNHPAHVRAQRLHGMREAGYGYWGFSPASNPAGGYREYGVDALGLNPDGYYSDQEMTNYIASDPPTQYYDGVVTPHASFLAMMHDRRAAVTNLSAIQSDFDSYGAGGFYDAVAVRSGTVARRYLSLDQAMSLGALGNVLLRNRLRGWFSDRSVRQNLRPVLAMEEFGAEL